MSKNCPKCQQVKPLADFHKTNNTRDGRQHVCAECMGKANEQEFQKKRDRAAKLDAIGGGLARYLINMARKRAKEKGLDCTIQPKDLVIPEVCPILLCRMERHTGKVQNHNYSLDRLDSTKGYVAGNVRVISWRANYIKNNISLEEAERLVAYMKGEI